MVQIDDKIISLDIIEKYFYCDLEKCKGVCCYYGDAGAPLENEEKILVEKHFPVIKQYLNKQAITAVKNQGFWIKDKEGDIVTPLIENQECAYAIHDNGYYKCAFELAFKNKKIQFQKPLSCHLYPIRIKSYDKFDAINFDPWKICSAALVLGKEKDIRLYEFLKIPLIRKYGKSFYKKLTIAAKEFNQKT
jgi:hypothetical protein